MSLAKADIVKEIRSRTGFLQNQAVETVETLLEIIKKSLASGDDVMVSGFGKFCIQDKRERRGRNPATGGDMVLKPRRIVTFKCSGKLRQRINGK